MAGSNTLDAHRSPKTEQGQGPAQGTERRSRLGHTRGLRQEERAAPMCTWSLCGKWVLWGDPSMTGVSRQLYTNSFCSSL